MGDSQATPRTGVEDPRAGAGTATTGCLGLSMLACGFLSLPFVAAGLFLLSRGPTHSGWVDLERGYAVVLLVVGAVPWVLLALFLLVRRLLGAGDDVRSPRR